VPELVASSIAERTKRRRAAVRWVSLTALVVALMAGTFPLLKKFRPKVDSASRHVTSHVHGLTLSPDGKLGTCAFLVREQVGIRRSSVRSVRLVASRPTAPLFLSKNMLFLVEAGTKSLY